MRLGERGGESYPGFWPETWKEGRRFTETGRAVGQGRGRGEFRHEVLAGETQVVLGQWRFLGQVGSWGRVCRLSPSGPRSVFCPQMAARLLHTPRHIATAAAAAPAPASPAVAVSAESPVGGDAGPASPRSHCAWALRSVVWLFPGEPLDANVTLAPSFAD